MIKAEHVSALIGKNIELVCFAQYSVYIHLEGNVMLTVEAGLEHTHNAARYVYEASSPFAASNIMSILENTVTSASVDPNGDLRLSMSNGDTLRIYKEPEFESYRIKIRDEEWIA